MCRWEAARAHLHLLNVGQLGLHVQDVVDLRLVGGRAGRQAARRRRRVRQRAAERQMLCAPDLRIARLWSKVRRHCRRQQKAAARPCMSVKPLPTGSPTCLPDSPCPVLPLTRVSEPLGTDVCSEMPGHLCGSAAFRVPGALRTQLCIYSPIVCQLSQTRGSATLATSQTPYGLGRTWGVMCVWM